MILNDSRLTGHDQGRRGSYLRLSHVRGQPPVPGITDHFFRAAGRDPQLPTHAVALSARFTRYVVTA